MKSILLEGTELSGKTTLANSVGNSLSNEGYSVFVNSGPIDKNSSLVVLPLKMAESVDSPYLKELFYTLSLAGDKSPGRVYDGEVDFLIQERSFPSVIAYSSVLNPFGVNRFLGGMLRQVYPSFDYNFLIKTSTNSRLARMNAKGSKTKLDEMVRSNPTLGVDLENEIKRILEGERNYTEVDTDQMEIEEATKYIMERIK